MKRRILAVATVLVCLMFCGCSPKTLRANSEIHEDMKTVIIDAGHGGFDGGAVAGDGTAEKNINLNIALVLRDLLKLNGYNTVMTRESDISTDSVETQRIASRKKSDLKNRLELTCRYSDGIFVSIHLNKFTTSAASGTQVFYGGNNPLSKQLSDCIQKTVVDNLQPTNHRKIKQATKSTFILFNTKIPAVLVECGFLSNKAELELLKNEEYQKKMAFCIFCGINDYQNGLPKGGK